MFSVVALIGWRGDAEPLPAAEKVRTLARGLSALRWSVAASLPASRGAGDLVLRLLFAHAGAWEAAGGGGWLDELAGHQEIASLEAAAYPLQDVGVRAPDLTDGVYRALFVCVGETASPTSVIAFARELAAMPDHIPEIRNWALSPCAWSRGSKRWTHVWEQEFGRVEDLTGPYMISPYHWAHVDRWFDPEMPDQIVAVDAIRHSASALEESLLALAAPSPASA